MIAAVLLAAGMSRRMGQAKMLLPWRRQPLVRHLANVALEASVDRLVIVTGFAHSAVGSTVADLPLQLVHNPRYADGQSTSLIAGLQSLDDGITAALVLLVDQPLITPQILNLLIAEYCRTPDLIVAPSYQGRRGNPVLFPRAVWPHLLALTGDEGGRSLFAALADLVRLVPVNTSAVVDDADTPDEYAALLKRNEAG